MGSCARGPGYASPAEAQRGPREQYLFVTAPNCNDGPDAIFCIDVNPESSNYLKVASRIDLPYKQDEVHHTGWNACSSCHDKPCEKRSHLIVPCLNSDRIYIINTLDPTNIYLDKIIEPEDLHRFNVSFPHTSHCLADGNIMISTLGTRDGSASGSFILLNGKTFLPSQLWPADDKTVAFNYDFWYQPRRNIMISTEWGSPKDIKHGFNPAHVTNNQPPLYGHSIHIFDWDTHSHRQTIDLPLPAGALPLEVRFKHEPSSEDAFVGTAFGSAIFRVHPDPQNPDRQVADLVAQVPAKKVFNWALPEMPALITDILISMDDRFLYASCWLHGEIRQYDISDPSNVVLNDVIQIGGSFHAETDITVENEEAPATYVKDRRIEGGPQMLQASLDGRRLYVTTSLYKKWDEQFYPNLLTKGATMLLVDICPKSGKMTLNNKFLVDFGDIEGGPYLAHEMRYPGGDCTSDIWI
ncbi:unnamed protein product [Caenorhabditis bovis]|uniref:Methanethiol oxidase n=1 Tax=Caenorhabditis bovis TaxID=2654633 RepID=A0A8S1FEA6_9PELO|nr:unnamed protein product [Caenorhabditis bovis]